MENASKALLISGGMLIAMLLLTFFSYMFTSIGEQSASIYEQMEAADIREFNQKFLQYDKDNRNDDEKYITIQDVATIVNLAIDSNKNQKYTNKIEVQLNGCACNSTKPIDNYSEGNKNRFLEDHIQDVINDTKFECTVSIESETAVVNKIVITMIK